MPANREAPQPSGSAVVVDAGKVDGGDGGRVVFFSPWGGSNKAQLGRERPTEGNPVGPMSFAEDGEGRVYVLDQVNGRIVRRGKGGEPEAAIDVKLRNAEDIAVSADGSMAVLDRTGDKAIAIYGSGGALLSTLPLEGEGVEETGELTGVFIDGKDVYVEREHGPLVRIGDTEGNAAAKRTEVPGRPSRDGKSFLNAGITDAQGGRAWVSAFDRARNDNRFTRELRLGGLIRSIQLLDSDKKGTIYFAAELGDDSETPFILLLCLDPEKGAPLGSAALPANTLPEETFRDLVVLDDGGVLLALRSDSGVSYTRYDCH